MEAPPQVDLPDGPISVSLCHDEMLRLPDFLRHHREIGVRHFIVVDNASTDGSGEYLDAQPDVTRLFTAKPYQKLKPIFRTWPCDHYLDGRWVMEPDIDEHLVYPGWPEVPLTRLVQHWERAGYGAVFAPMVDMYSDRPLGEVAHDADDRLLEAYPLFDAEGYWVAPPKRKSRRTSPTPPYILFGGARVRVGRGAGRSTFRQRLQRAAIRCGHGLPQCLAPASRCPASAPLAHDARRQVRRHEVEGRAREVATGLPLPRQQPHGRRRPAARTRLGGAAALPDDDRLRGARARVGGAQVAGAA